MKKRILYIATILCIATLFTGCQNPNTNPNTNPNQNEVIPDNTEMNTQKESDKNTFFYYEDEIQQDITDTSFGNTEFGYITLSSEYKAQDVSSLYDTDMYYIATSQILGVSFLSSVNSLETLLESNYEMEGYTAEKEETVAETEKYEVIKSYGKNDKGNFYGMGFIYNKETSKTVIISVANFIEMDYELFKSSCEEIFKSHSYGLF